jgi:hypothetical protein
VTDGELAVLRSRAASAGVSVPRLLAESALGPPGSTVSERRAVMVTLLAARRVLAGAANNLNQVARWSNIHEDAHVDVDAAVAAVSAAAAVFESRVDDVAAAGRGRPPDVPAGATEAQGDVE